MVDYYCRWIEIAQLHTMTSKEIISHMKSIFARFGIPEKVISDNASYYTSDEFRLFSIDYSFIHTKCKALVRHSVWWPGLSHHIEELVAKCRKCAIVL